MCILIFSNANGSVQETEKPLHEIFAYCAYGGCSKKECIFGNCQEKGCTCNEGVCECTYCTGSVCRKERCGDCMVYTPPVSNHCSHGGCANKHCLNGNCKVAGCQCKNGQCSCAYFTGDSCRMEQCSTCRDHNNNQHE